MATSQPSSSTAAPDSSQPATTDSQPHKPVSPSAQPSSSPAATGCLASVQRCQARTEAFNARLEAKEAARKRRKKEGSVVDDEGKEPGFGGDATWLRKGMVPAVFVIMWWVYSVFVARLCVPAIQRTDQALASRATGIALLVAATLLVLMTLWTYLRVLVTAPGYVRDHVGVSDCPPEEEDEYYGRPPPGAAWGVQAQQQQQAPYPQPWDPDAVDAQQQQPEPNEQGDELPVDPSLPAIVGPVATAAIANADVEAPSPPNTTQFAPPQQQAQQQHFFPAQPGAPRPLIPKPARLPPSKPVLAQGNRYCFRCQRVKPPRAHHCRRCGTCVLRMDHHCPWVGGCVGARNHKFFFHFVTWTTIYELFLLISSAVLFQRGVKGGPGYEAWRVDGFVISLFVLCSVFTLFTGALFTTHLYLLTHNMTTIEHLSFDRQKRSEEALLSAYFSNAGQGGPGIKIKERREVRKEWDQAWGRMKMEGNLWWRDGREKGTSAERANWSAVMGEKWWMWIVPLGHSESDGLHYPPNPRFSARGVQRPRSMWPPELQ